MHPELRSCSITYSIRKDLLVDMNKKQLGVYIHIPFCKSKCAYCDFLSGPSNDKMKEEYVEALIRQIKVYAYLAQVYQVRTIYIGGGTPSSIAAKDIQRILNTVYSVFDIQPNSCIEITMEANPGTLTEEKLLIYKKSGINRLSIGLQSTNDDELRLLGRIHTYQEFVENYQLARACGYDNINIDLMSALPGQTIESWEKTVTRVIELNPEHISAYSLIIEEGTPFYERYEDGEGLPTEEEDRQMYHITKNLLRKAGYERYEISNYAKPGYESRHNSSYWERIDYIGFGLGASSCINNTRFHNEDNLQVFIENDYTQELGKKEVQELSVREQMEEFMFLGLRMMKGVDLGAFDEEFHVDFDRIYGKKVEELIHEDLLCKQGNKVKLTERGIDLSNYVMSEFLLG